MEGCFSPWKCWVCCTYSARLFSKKNERVQCSAEPVACEIIRFFRLKFLVFLGGRNQKLEPKKPNALAGYTWDDFCGKTKIFLLCGSKTVRCQVPPGTVKAQPCSAVILKVFFLSKMETCINNSIYCYVTLFEQRKKKRCCEGHLEIRSYLRILQTYQD